MKPALIALGVVALGAAGVQFVPAVLEAITQSPPRSCVAAVSTGGSLFLVLTPEGEEVSRHSQQHTAQASATNAAWERPGEVFLISRVLEIRVSVDPACVVTVPDTMPPVVPPSENLLPDSIHILGDPAEVAVGEDIPFPLVVWWTIPQEADLGSRPFLCFGGEHGLDYGITFPGSPEIPDGWLEITFPEGLYPEWALLENGHAFLGECMSAEVMAAPVPGQSA